MTQVENDPQGSQEILAAMHPHTGRAHIVGITGSPGSGKSTLVARLTRVFRERGHRVGIVAVDPSSPFSGGAVLGDRIRSRDLAGDDGVFFRSAASRASLGGLSAATADHISLLDACGYDRICVETVGAGQSEVEIAQHAHTTVVLQVPDAGDHVQTLKAGILEIADILVVNKSDLPGADSTAAMLRAMLEVGGESGDGEEAAWNVPVLRTDARAGIGVDEVVDAIEDHVAYLRASGRLRCQEFSRAEQRLESALASALLHRLLSVVGEARVAAAADAIVSREIDAHSAAGELIAHMDVLRGTPPTHHVTEA